MAGRARRVRGRPPPSEEGAGAGEGGGATEKGKHGHTAGLCVGQMLASGSWTLRRLGERVPLSSCEASSPHCAQRGASFRFRRRPALVCRGQMAGGLDSAHGQWATPRERWHHRMTRQERQPEAEPGSQARSDFARTRGRREGRPSRCRGRNELWVELTRSRDASGEDRAASGAGTLTGLR